MINIGVTTPNERRLQLLTLLASMPEEAFLWLVVALQPPPGLPPHASPWPDGLGGFRTESREAIAGVQAAAAAYLNPREEP